jgi:integrase
MADTRYLKKEYQTWIFVQAVPRDLRWKLGKRLIVKSTKTTSLVEARKVRNIYLYETQQMFAKVRGGVPTADPELDHDTGEPIETPEEAGIGIAMELLYEKMQETADPLEKARLWSEMEDWDGRLKELRGQQAVSLAPVGKTPRFSVAGEAYLAERHRDKGTRMAASTERTHRTAYRLFADYAHDPTLGSIDRKMASGFLDTIATLHPQWGKHAGTDTMPLKELVRHYGQGDVGLSNNSLNHYTSALRSLYNWSRRRGDVQGDNPFAEQHRKIADAGWQPYTPAELKTLLRQMQDPLRWYVLIALYSGMRLGEICVTKIENQDGISFFNVTQGKTRNAIRKVPVHSELRAAGILSANYRTMSSAKVTAAFNQLRTRIGLTRDRLSFHSLRKNFTTALDVAAVPYTDIAMLLGHKRSFSLDVYSGGPGLIRLCKAIEGVRY